MSLYTHSLEIQQKTCEMRRESNGIFLPCRDFVVLLQKNYQTINKTIKEEIWKSS